MVRAMKRLVVAACALVLLAGCGDVPEQNLAGGQMAGPPPTDAQGNVVPPATIAPVASGSTGGSDKPGTQIGDTLPAGGSLSCEDEYRMIEAAVLSYVGRFGAAQPITEDVLVAEGYLGAPSERYDVIAIGDIDPVGDACTVDLDGR
jgi:hypothetical protein